jgi:hypothetical protein
VKRIVPQKILAARHERLEQGSTPPADRSGAGLLERVVAQCYYHLRLPALARPFREQFQLNISPTGKPKLSWSRRKEASVRILSSLRFQRHCLSAKCVLSLSTTVLLA